MDSNEPHKSEQTNANMSSNHTASEAFHSNGEQEHTTDPVRSDDQYENPEQAFEKIEKEIEQLVFERDDFKDKHLRALADLENFRRRTEKELEDMKTYAFARFAKDVLNTLDNLQRSAALTKDTQRPTEEQYQALCEGIRLVERELIQTLERYKIKEIDPNIVKFNPNLHQAMFEMPRDDVEQGTIIEVIQKGYQIDQRVLRPALVGLAKGGDKPQKGDE